jgi:hypothetical protein
MVKRRAKMDIDRFDTELIPTLFKTAFDTPDDYSVPFYGALDKIFSHGIDIVILSSELVHDGTDYIVIWSIDDHGKRLHIVGWEVGFYNALN